MRIKNLINTPLHVLYQWIGVISPMSRFANNSFANILGRFANVLSRFANVLPVNSPTSYIQY